MDAVRVIRALGPIDLHNVLRDSLLRWMFVMALAIGALLRWGIPPLTIRISTQFDIDIEPYFTLVMSFVLMLMPILVGMIIGFLLLDERDDNTLSALQVTPLSLNGYLIYRLTVPVAVSVLLTVLVFEIADVMTIGIGRLLLLSIAAAPMAPIFALFLASFAANKVQGFALTKANGVVTLPPVVAYFVDGNWQLLFGIVPTYWPVKAFWQSAAGATDFWIYAIVALVVQGGVLVLLIRRFDRVTHR